MLIFRTFLFAAGLLSYQISAQVTVAAETTSEAPTTAELSTEAPTKTDAPTTASPNEEATSSAPGEVTNAPGPTTVPPTTVSTTTTVASTTARADQCYWCVVTAATNPQCCQIICTGAPLSTDCDAFYRQQHPELYPYIIDHYGAPVDYSLPTFYQSYFDYTSQQGNPCSAYNDFAPCTTCQSNENTQVITGNNPTCPCASADSCDNCQQKIGYNDCSCPVVDFGCGRCRTAECANTCAQQTECPCSGAKVEEKPKATCLTDEQKAEQERLAVEKAKEAAIIESQRMATIPPETSGTSVHFLSALSLLILSLLSC